MEINRLQITGQVVWKNDLRTSPGGIQHGDLRLRHRSIVAEAGNNREVVAEITVRFSGPEMAASFGNLELSDEVLVEGFLAQSQSPFGAEDKNLVLHATGVKKS